MLTKPSCTASGLFVPVPAPRALAEWPLPDGAARLSCLVAGGDRPGDVRLRFVDVDGETAERLAGLLHAEQRRIAAEQGTGTPL